MKNRPFNKYSFKFIFSRKALFCLILIAFQLKLAVSQTTLPYIFSDNMILQRKNNIPVWGNSSVGTEITVEFNGYKSQAKTDEKGKWFLRLPAMEAGGPYIMNVYEGIQKSPVITFKNVLVGDVWLASGQSNMEWQVQQGKDAEAEIINADFPEIRFFKTPHNKQIEIQTDTKKARWEICDTTSIKDKSAVAYFFARKLHKDVNVPVGIIQSTWGGTPVEAWMSKEQLLSSSITRKRLMNNDSVTNEHFIKDSLDLIRFWEIVYNPQNKMDKKIPKTNFDDSKWDVLEMPKTFHEWNWPFYEGIVWMRKKIDLPESMQGKDLIINLGKPEMNYSLYFNGSEICKTIWNANTVHYYKIPSNLVKKEGNVIAVRIAVLWGGGGFNPPPENMYITDSITEINIAGNWKYMKDLEPEIPEIRNYHQYPSYLFNGMIYPLIPYGLKGFIWYQGENNVDKAQDYQILFPLLISDWRIRWQQGYLPFIFVQLANYMEIKSEPVESNWAELREAQTLTLNQPNTGMACIIDIGEAETIHPLNKQEVGRRVALLAEQMTFNSAIQPYGPKYKSCRKEGKSIVIQFYNAEKGLLIKGEGKLNGFAIAGKDEKYYWAEAVIKGNEVVVSSRSVKDPVAVRYAWADNPVCNLINSEGLPAIPFRTDSRKFESKTDNK